MKNIFISTLIFHNFKCNFFILTLLGHIEPKSAI
jgi:hypothetical protein